MKKNNTANNSFVSDWNIFFSELLLNKDDRDIASLFRFVKSRLYQFRLTKHYKPREVLTEAYLRGLEPCKKGEEIKNKLAWARTTSYNIIREFRRELDRINFEDLDDVPLSSMRAYLSYQENSSSDSSPNEEMLKAIRVAFSDLSFEDRELLNLKVVQELSWKEVHKCLRQCWAKVPTENALRQRKRRAIQRLTEGYTHHISNVASDSED